jgi:hypothetical protein
MALAKIANRMGVMQAMQGSDIYNQISRFWGDIKAPVVDAYNSASGFVTENFITPFRAGFDNLFGGAANEIAIDSTEKLSSISGLIGEFQQQLMSGLKDVLMEIGGQDLTNMIVVTDDMTGKISFAPGMESLVMAFQIYSIARLIGHIIFACKKEEFEWGMNDKWRLCTFADTCCSKKVFLLGCVEKRELYCCYKSIAIRVIATQIITKNLAGTRPQGFRSTNDGRSIGGCGINCGGFTAFELAAVDWSRVDLTEWTDSLIESGLINPTNPGTNFGVSQNQIKESMVVSRDADPAGNYTTVVPAVKSAEILSPNVDDVIDNAGILRDAGENCYDQDSRKMPFVYPGCRTQP